MHGIVIPEASGKIVAVIPACRQNSGGNVAAQAALADEVDRLCAVQLPDPFPQRIHRNIEESLDMSAGKFLRRAAVQQDHAAVTRQTVRIFQIPLLYKPVFQILGDETGHVHGRFGG